MTAELESAITQKVKPLVESAMQKYLGIKVADIEADITDQLKQTALLDIAVDVKLPFKAAKKAFKRAYLMRLLRQHLGNISTAADAAGVDRRSVHRLVTSLKIPTTKMRESAQPDYVRKTAVQTIVEDVLGQYKAALNPAKYKVLYEHSEALSEDIVKELPDTHLTFKAAEIAFERAYLGQLLSQSRSIAEAAKKAKLRYEVLHRKLRMLGIKPQ
jgi:DNA-binding NtrC family response regulator